MRQISALLIALLILLPGAGFAQTPQTHPTPGTSAAAAQQKSAPAAVPAPTAPAVPVAAAEPPDTTSRLLTIGLGAITGMIVLTVAGNILVSRSALATLGQGALVFGGTVSGGLFSNWFYNHLS